MDSDILAELVEIKANQESILSKLDTLLEANEKLEKERTELAEHMKSSGLGAIFDVMNEQS